MDTKSREREPNVTQVVTQAQIEAVQRYVNPERLVETARALVDAPSPSRSAGPAANKLAEILERDGFRVSRPVADWPDSPAVVVRFDSGKPGRTLQFDGHLDTVHLPYFPSRVENGKLYGSGSADMKGGIAAYVEALRALRDGNLLNGGSILITAHDHHEGPWGDRRQLHALIREGYTGDAVMLPEYLATYLPVAGRGMAIFELTIQRPGSPVHEVLRPPGTPDVIGAGADVLMALRALKQRISSITAPYVGNDSVFVGMFQSGEIFNQSPTQCIIKGTRRWVTPGQADQVMDELRSIFADVAATTGTQIDVSFDLPGDAFRIDLEHPLVAAFQNAITTVSGAPLPVGAKPFVDDGNIFAAAGITPITHGPNATGAHTLHEEVPIDELVRVAHVYALTSLGFCPAA